ncbi:hypothetical protein [Mesorhizobium kowhaii]|nr:hypothetical protein [Mesorhizobium kowhaii]
MNLGSDFVTEHEQRCTAPRECAEAHLNIHSSLIMIWLAAIQLPCPTEMLSPFICSMRRWTAAQNEHAAEIDHLEQQRAGQQPLKPDLILSSTIGSSRRATSGAVPMEASQTVQFLDSRSSVEFAGALRELVWVWFGS